MCVDKCLRKRLSWEEEVGKEEEEECVPSPTDCCFVP